MHSSWITGMPSSSTDGSSGGLRAKLCVWARVVGITLAFTFLVTECGLRIAGIEYPDFYRQDARRGWSHQPGISGWHRSEGEAFITISSQGLRDREHAIAKPLDTIRIAVLGDSFSEARQVPAEQAFWAVIEKELASCPRYAGKKIEAINFGVSSYGTANEYLTLQDAVWQFSPDVVLVAFLTGNDFMDNVPTLDHVAKRPYYRLASGKLELDLSRNQPLPAAKRAWHFGQRHLHVVQLAQRLREVRAGAARAKGNELGLDDDVYKPPTSPAWQQAWDVTRALLLAIRDDIERHKATMMLATLSNAMQVNPDASVREAFMKKLGTTTLFYPDEELAKFAGENRIPVVTTAPSLLATATEQKKCLHGFANATPCGGHWNADGHAAAGRVIAHAMCEGAPNPTTER